MILGIDPGKKGALAWVTSTGQLDCVRDMPADRKALADLIRLSPVDMLVIERVSSRPGEGHVGALTTGYGGGVLEGIALGAGIPYRVLDAANWKRFAGVTSDKNFCRAKARKLWPGQAELFSLAKHDGRADAALLAHWFATSGGRQAPNATEQGT